MHCFSAVVHKINRSQNVPCHCSKSGICLPRALVNIKLDTRLPMSDINRFRCSQPMKFYTNYAQKIENLDELLVAYMMHDHPQAAVGAASKFPFLFVNLSLTDAVNAAPAVLGIFVATIGALSLALVG